MLQEYFGSNEFIAVAIAWTVLGLVISGVLGGRKDSNDNTEDWV